MKKILILVVVLIPLAVAVTKFRGNSGDVSEFANEAALGNVATAEIKDGEYRVHIESITENPDDTMLSLSRVTYKEGETAKPTGEAELRAPVDADTEFELLANDDASLNDFTAQVLGATKKHTYLVEIKDGRIERVEELR